MQILYGLAKEKQTGDTFFADNLSKAVLFTPCSVGVQDEYEDYANGLFKYQELGIYSINGSDWRDHERLICDKLGEEACFEAIFYSTFGSSVSVQSMLHHG